VQGIPRSAWRTYVDLPETRSVTGGHVLVHGLNGVGARHVAVLLVHVVGARTGVVADPDTEVLDLKRVLLVDLYITTSVSQCLPTHFVPYMATRTTYLVQSDNLAIRLLDLAQLGQEVPEARLGNYLIWRKNAHAVELGGWVGVRGEEAANDLVFLQATCWGTESALSNGETRIVCCLKSSVCIHSTEFDRHRRCHRVFPSLARLLRSCSWCSQLFQPISTVRRSALVAMLRNCLPICEDC
jgi:hypothetical protein